MKPILLCIVGPSGSGKTHMSHYLHDRFGIPFVVSMTTRQMRAGETDGTDHRFVKSEDIAREKKLGNVMAYARFGGHEYCALHSDVGRNPIISYVIDEQGLEQLTLNHSHRYTIIAIYVDRPERKRIKSGVDRQRMERDKRRRRLPPEYYDAIILNDGTLERFEERIVQAMLNTKKEL